MSSIISVHSFRGGTGKSNVTANLAATVALAGHRVGIVDLGVDLAGGAVAIKGLDELGELLAGGAHRGEDHHGRDEAAVGAVVVAEVVVTRVLTSEGRTGLGHELLDERVPDARTHRRAAVFGDDRVAEATAMASRAPLDLRVNTLKAKRETVLASVAHLGAAPTPGSPT